MNGAGNAQVRDNSGDGEDDDEMDDDDGLWWAPCQNEVVEKEEKDNGKENSGAKWMNLNHTSN